MARRGKRGRSHAGLWALPLILLAAAAGSVWWLRRQRGESRGCPSLTGGALAQSKAAKFTTVEQLRHEARAAGVVRLQARLDAYRLEGKQYQLRLGSLVNPGESVAALLPPGSCMADSDDAALLDELRQDVRLRFGPPTAAGIQPGVTVVVTGVAEPGPKGARLRPVLDLHVQ